MSTDLRGLRLYDVVLVGEDMLTGEVVRIEKDRAVVQVYESTRALGIGEPVRGTGTPLVVSLGPGLLGAIFDGLQRPLERLREVTGHFITRAHGMHAVDPEARWKFHPLLSAGQEVRAGHEAGYFEEGPFKHMIIHGGEDGAKALRVAEESELTVDDPLVALEGGREIKGCHAWPARTPRPCRRKLPPSEPLVTGQRIIDFLYPIARGGTAIMPGGFGTGKTVLEQSVAKFADVDIVVYVGCGERGNEMADLIEEFQALKDPWSGRALMERTILVANTSNMPVAARESSIYTAVAMAEYYRDMGYDVLLLADSLSRWAEAVREISSSLGEMPGEEGYPTYLASKLSAFFERAGVVETLSGKRGSLTMVVSVSPPGGDLTEPVTQACLRVAGAFHMLDTSLAHRRHFPAINWSQSYSLYRGELCRLFEERHSVRWSELYDRAVEILQAEASLAEITEIVGPEGLQDADRLVMKTAEAIRTRFLAQNAFTEDAFSKPEDTVALLEGIVSAHDEEMARLREGAEREGAGGGEGKGQSMGGGAAPGKEG
ncbi:MAG: V-type ATP synthase subunit A [Thermodesulfovibrionales bacterium]